MIVFNIIILVVQEKAIAFTPAAAAAYVPQPGERLVTCDKCGWQSYYTPDRARRGLAGHKNWCKREH